ncbi:Brp/Blh family beta-carotene 15,15'-dioxygenase [Natrialba sp. INN-245]|uniref:Brp/Blh family beta-carotene 15,15'-dioxygenase n=1 Tax=Natrialba sp. INN-245 TaxID=2690967 RepID=UPI00130FBB73|nr:Brp/Blh family beta-carotene 15,15'-dioxygenase [Natrialba sp. INN-245]MWV38996.1 beta-carotene 15,15'-dioxygenase, Brp/Blh family [Natrialba sp. INN-245]
MSTNTNASAESPNARERAHARNVARVVSLAAATMVLGLGFALTALTGSLPLWVQYLPLLASVLLLGLPHGAVDHLVLPRARNEPITVRALAAVGALYLVAGTAYAAVWLLAPLTAFSLFILLTLFHWGQGDVYVLDELVGVDYLETPVRRMLTLLVRGGAPMVVPLIAFPGQYAFVAGTVVGLFDPGVATALESLIRTQVRLLVGAAFGAVVVATLGVGYLRSEGSRSWMIDAGETVGLLAFFALVPPVLAIGLYFCFWHSVRHILRTMLVDDGTVSALAEPAVGRACRRFVRDATPLTVGGIVVCASIALLVPQTPATVPEIGGLYLVALAILTLPHVVVVSLLDRAQGLWPPSPTHD